jgi:hypothetical protein
VGDEGTKVLAESFREGGCAQLTTLNLESNKFVFIVFSLLSTSHILLCEQTPNWEMREAKHLQNRFVKEDVPS